MGNIINFMEKLGASAEFQELSESEVLKMLQQENDIAATTTDIEQAFELLITPRKNIVCGIFPAEEPAEDQPGEDEEDDEQTAQSINKRVVNG